jgi:hypothetical protein
MKYEGYIVGSENEWAILTDEDIAKYPRKYEMETTYSRDGDITFIWALTILCTPDGDVELSKQIINFMHGGLDEYSRKYAESCFQNFLTYGTVDITQKLLFEITED